MRQFGRSARQGMIVRESRKTAPNPGGGAPSATDRRGTHIDSRRVPPIDVVDSGILTPPRRRPLPTPTSLTEVPRTTTTKQGALRPWTARSRSTRLSCLRRADEGEDGSYELGPLVGRLDVGEVADAVDYNGIHAGLLGQESGTD
jgi:hypothetical protein